jgi:MoaA/NifB/PqqE/SkfB family radical SAM enzyme
MDYLIEQGLASNIMITLLSNGSSSPAPLVEKYKKFRGVIYNVSIDGVGDVIEYQRRGCNWAEVEANALELMKHDSIVCVMNFVLTAINALNIMDYVDWCFEHQLGPQDPNDSRVFYNISPVFRVDHLGVGALPLELRELALLRLAQGRERYQQMPATTLTQYFVGVIDQFTTVINNTAHDPKYLQPFIQHIEKEDSVSKKTLAQAVPEWAPYFQS